MSILQTIDLKNIMEKERALPVLSMASLVTLVLGTGLGFICVQAAKSANPYFFYSFPWPVILLYLAILLIVQMILISYTTGSLKKHSLVEQIRVTE